MSVSRIPTWLIRIRYLALLSFLYAMWFNWLDTIPGVGAFLSEPGQHESAALNSGLAGDTGYQIWNWLGHFIPASFYLIMLRGAYKTFWIAAGLLSTGVMDSPLWGVTRMLRGYADMDNGFWCRGAQDFDFPQCGFADWLAFYYNPIGAYPVLPAFPVGEASIVVTSAAIFWSFLLRISLFGFIWFYFISKRKTV